MERATTKIKTPSGFEIELKTYITGGEKRIIKDVFLDAVQISTDGTAVKSEGMKGILVNEMENKLIETIVVAVNGVKENVLKAVLDLPAVDFEEIVRAVNKVSEGLPAEKKTP